MKNPRGYIISSMLIAMMLMFVLGPIQGNPQKAERYNAVYSMNSPPGQIVIAIIETPTFQITVAPAVCTQIARGVSVPDRGLMVSTALFINIKFNQYQEGLLFRQLELRLNPTLTTSLNGNHSVVNDCAGDLGLRSAPSLT
jgi:hypothetical protein